MTIKTAKTVKTATPKTVKTPAKTAKTKTPAPVAELFAMRDLATFEALDEATRYTALLAYNKTLTASACVTAELVAHKVAIVGALQVLEVAKAGNAHTARLHTLAIHLLTNGLEGKTLTQTAVGKLLGVTQGTVNKYKTAQAVIDLGKSKDITVSLSAVLVGINKGTVKASEVHKMDTDALVSLTHSAQVARVQDAQAQGVAKRTGKAQGKRVARPEGNAKGKTPTPAKVTVASLTADTVRDIKALPDMVKQGALTKGAIVEALELALADIIAQG